jgi:hypothetical protein
LITNLDSRRPPQVTPKILDYVYPSGKYETYTLIGVVGSNRKLYALDVTVFKQYFDTVFPELLDDVDGNIQFPINAELIAFAKNMAVKTNDIIGSASGHFRSYSTDSALYMQRNVIYASNITCAVSRWDLKQLGKITTSTKPLSEFPELVNGVANYKESVMSWTCYLGNGTVYYGAKRAMGPIRDPAVMSYDWNDFIAPDASIFKDAKITNSNTALSYSQNALPAPVQAWDLMPGYVLPQMPFVAMSQIRAASQISLDDALAHGATMTSVLMYPGKVDGSSMFSVMQNITKSNFLKEGTNVGYLRWMFTALPVITFDTSILPNAMDVNMDITNLAEAMVSSAMSGIYQDQIGMQYVARQTPRSCVFNNMGYTNTEFVFSDAFRYMYWFVPRFPYYVVSKGSYGICVTTITDHSDAVLWIKNMNKGSDAMFPLANCITPEEYLMIDGFSFAKHKFFYETYIKTGNIFLPPSQDPSAFSEVLIGAYPFELNLPATSNYVPVDTKLASDDTPAISTLSPSYFSNLKENQYAFAINELRKNGLSPEENWKNTPLDAYEVVFAKGRGKPETGTIIHHEPYNPGIPSVLLSISTESDVLGSILDELLEKQIKYMQQCLGSSGSVELPVNAAGRSFYTLITFVDLNDQLYKMASSYQIIADIYGGVGYYIVEGRDENNESRSTLWGSVLGNALAYRQVLFETHYEISADVYLRGFSGLDTANSTVSKIINLPFGALHKTPRIVKFATKQSNGSVKYNYVNVEVDTLNVFPTSITKVYDTVIADGRVTVSKIHRAGKFLIFHTDKNLIFFNTENAFIKQLSWPKPVNVTDLDFCHIGNFQETLSSVLNSYANDTRFKPTPA